MNAFTPFVTRKIFESNPLRDGICQLTKRCAKNYYQRYIVTNSIVPVFHIMAICAGTNYACVYANKHSNEHDTQKHEYIYIYISIDRDMLMYTSFTLTFDSREHIVTNMIARDT
jgi:hypothetical protein